MKLYLWSEYSIAYQMVTRIEKEQQAIQLHKEGKGTREISKRVHMNLTDIGSILHREFPEEYADRTPVLAIETQALQLFTEGKTLVEVAIMLNAKPEEVMEMHKNYLRLEFRHTAAKILEEYKNQPKSLLGLLLEVRRSKLGLRGAAEALRSKNDLLSARRELVAINMQIGQKMNDYASLVLRGIPNVRSHSSRVDCGNVLTDKLFNADVNQTNTISNF